VEDSFDSSREESKEIESWLVAIGMILVIMFVPFHFIWESNVFVLDAIAWGYTLNISFGTQGIHFYSPDIWFAYAPLFIFSFLFAVWMVRLYEMKTTVKLVMVLGLLASLPFVIINLINILPSVWNPEWPYRVLHDFPLPLPAAVGYFLIRLRPPPKPPQSWIDEAEVS
jgi:hypothetical protein